MKKGTLNYGCDSAMPYKIMDLLIIVAIVFLLDIIPPKYQMLSLTRFNNVANQILVDFAS